MSTPPATGEASLLLLAHRVERMHEDFSGIQAVLKDLTAAINKLTLVEERQAQMGDSLRRAFAGIEKLDTRIAKLESRQPDNNRTSAWVDRAVWSLAAAAVMFMATKSGLKL